MAMKRKNLPEVVPKFFEHEQFGEIRFIRQNGELWFVAVDLCRALDIQNIRQNLEDFPDDEKQTVLLRTITNAKNENTKNDSKNGVTNTVSNTYGISDAIFSNPDTALKKGISGGWIENRVTVVSEPGLYRLIFMSRKPEAEKFKRWVFHEVLPSIRKYGYYLAPYQKIISIKGAENFKKFKAQYPEGAVEVKATYLDADENEYGEEGMAYLRYKVVLHSNKLGGGF